MTQGAKKRGLMAHLLAALGAGGRTRLQPSPAIVLLLIAMTITAYWGVGQCGFVNLDDDAYVEGITACDLEARWAVRYAGHS